MHAPQVHGIVMGQPKFLSANTLGANRKWRRGDSRNEARLRRVELPEQMLRICGGSHPLTQAGSPLEAGGFEPPSRNASRPASTHLVVFVFYRLHDRQTTANRFGYSGICLSPSARKLRREQPTFLRPNQARRRNLKGRVAYLGGHSQLVIAN